MTIDAPYSKQNVGAEHYCRITKKLSPLPYHSCRKSPSTQWCPLAHWSIDHCSPRLQLERTPLLHNDNGDGMRWDVMARLFTFWSTL